MNMHNSTEGIPDRSGTVIDPDNSRLVRFVLCSRALSSPWCLSRMRVTVGSRGGCASRIIYAMMSRELIRQHLSAMELYLNNAFIHLGQIIDKSVYTVIE
jgi:hypothetical protein